MTTPYYQDDHVTIYHGDCLEMAELWTCADVLVTDPPYGMAYVAGGGRPSRPIAGDRDTTARDSALFAWRNALDRTNNWHLGRPALMFGRWDITHPTGAHTCLTWDKGDWPGMGDLSEPWGPSTENIYVLDKGFVGPRRGTVLRFNRVVASGLHPTEKPADLMVYLVGSTVGTVADPFMGSGTTLRAAKDLGRKAIGIELEERYCEIAAKRCSQEVLDFGAA